MRIIVSAYASSRRSMVAKRRAKRGVEGESAKVADLDIIKLTSLGRAPGTLIDDLKRIYVYQIPDAIRLFA